MLGRTGVAQGFGLGFIFIPLSTIAYATLQPRYRTEAAPVFSLTRHMGSNIDISMVMLVLTRNIPINSAYLSELVTPLSLGIGVQQLPQGLLSQAEGATGLLRLEIARNCLYPDESCRIRLIGAPAMPPTLFQACAT